MANDKKVEQITDMEVDFAQWFTDVCKKAQLIEYSSIKGVFIYRPYGYAIWENMQKILDASFKQVGVENVYMPMLIPESLLQREKDHVEGFAPECAWVTMGGSEKLEEACRSMLTFSGTPNIRSLMQLLKTPIRQSTASSPASESHGSRGITRGASQFRKEGGQ